MGSSVVTSSILIACFFFPLLFHFSYSSPSLLPIGAHPLDEKYYESELIKCKDGSKSFTRDRINDNFCDCLDGTDEPGTSACPMGKFYCKNVGNKPKFLFSSHVNDYICDCCDGSDEHDGNVICPNTCIMGGNFAYHSIRYDSRIRRQGSVGAEKTKLGLNANYSIEKFKGLKVLLILQVVLVAIVVTFWVFRRRGRSRRRHSR